MQGILVSMYAWEQATITLPSAAVTPLKKALRDKANRRHGAVRAAVTTWHKHIGTRSTSKYRKTLWDGDRAPVNGDIANDARHVLSIMLETAERDGSSIHQPTVADVNQVAPAATNRTTTFCLEDSATIAFEGRVLHWDVPEGNDAPGRAHDHPLGQVLFAYLGCVQWTPGTGGYGAGNCELASEDREVGGGANYTTFTYGPIGEARKAADCGMSLKKYRQAQTRATAASRFSPAYGRRW